MRDAALRALAEFIPRPLPIPEVVGVGSGISSGTGGFPGRPRFCAWNMASSSDSRKLLPQQATDRAADNILELMSPLLVFRNV